LELEYCRLRSKQSCKDLNFFGFVQAQCLASSERQSLKTLWPKDAEPKDAEEGGFKLIVQLGPKTTDELGPVPSIFDFLKTEDDRKVLEFHFNAKLLGRPLAGPAGVAPERLAVVRKAFQDTMRDPEFLTEAHKANLDIDPATQNLPPIRRWNS
jgi:hypothetical protein